MSKFFKIILNASIRIKLICMCFIVIVPAFGAGVYLLSNMSENLNTSAKNEAYSDVENLKYRLNDTIVNIEAISESIYSSSYFSNIFEADTKYNQIGVENPISLALASSPQLDDIVLFLDRDEVAKSSHIKKIDDEIKNSYWFKTLSTADGPVWHVSKNPNDGNNYFSLSRHIYDKNNDYLGVMTLYLSPEWLDGLIPSNGYDMIFTLKNGIVFHSTVGDYPIESVFNGITLFEKIGVATGATFNSKYAGNIFNIYLVKPYKAVNEDTTVLVTGYVWYMLLCFILSILLTFLFSGYIAKQIKFLSDEMHKVTLGDFRLTETLTGTDEISKLYNDLKTMVDSMQRLTTENFEAKLQSETLRLRQIEAEFKTLASQINPHFLYNTLETIRMKAFFNGDKETADLVKKLGKFMRRCLELKDGPVELESELEFTRSYLELQAARFGDRITYSINCDVEKNTKILPLIIQPIVENAFIHGVEGSKENGHIDINLFYLDDKINIYIIDNGQGMSEKRLLEIREKLIENDTSSGKSIGLTNVNKRIKIYHGKEYGLTVFSAEGKGTRVSIKIPIDGEDIICRNQAENLY